MCYMRVKLVDALMAIVSRGMSINRKERKMKARTHIAMGITMPSMSAISLSTLDCISGIKACNHY